MVYSVDVFSKWCSLNNKKGSWEKTIYISPLTLSEYWKLLVPAGLAIFWEGVKWRPTCTRFTQETSAPWPTWLRRCLFNPALSESSVPVPAADSDPEHRNVTAAALGVDGERENEKRRERRILVLGRLGFSHEWDKLWLVSPSLHFLMVFVFVTSFLICIWKKKTTRTTKLSLFTANMHFWSRIRIHCCLTLATLSNLSNINSF